MWMRHTQEAIAEAVAKSRNWSEVCRLLGIEPATGAQTHVSRRAKKWGIDWSHFTGRPSVPQKRKQPIDAYLTNQLPIRSHSLREKLIASGRKEHKCEKCGLTEWLGEPIPLELDHIDGNHWNNADENVWVICPNCHALKTRQQRAANKKTYLCPGCGRKILKRSKSCIYCRPSYPRKTKIPWPEISELRTMIAGSNVVTTARNLGVSDKALRKHVLKMGGKQTVSALAATQ